MGEKSLAGLDFKTYVKVGDVYEETKLVEWSPYAPTPDSRNRSGKAHMHGMKKCTRCSFLGLLIRVLECIENKR